MVRGSRSLATLLATALLASPALGEPRPPSEKDKQAAGDLVKKAIAKSQAGEHDAAIAIYLQAYAIVPSSALLSNIGAEYVQSGKPQDALRYFCMYLEKDPSGASAPYATTQARVMQRQLGARHVDDAHLCAPSPSKVEPRAATPAPDEPLPRSRPAEPPRPPQREASHRNMVLKYAGLAAGITGLAAAGVGFYEGVQAKNVSDEISNHPTSQPWPTGIRQLEQRGQHDENLEIGFLIAGGALVATGVILFAVGRSSPSEHTADKAVRVAPTTSGFAVFGRF